MRDSGGDGGRLTAERVAALEAVLGWTWDPIEDDWQAGLAYLRAYVERERHARVPKRHVSDDGYALGQWVLRQRSERRKGQLRDERAAALEAVPSWSWEPFRDDWQEGLAHLRDYVERERHARVPSEHVSDDGYALGQWVLRQRSERRKGQLRDERAAALEAVPSWSWEPFRDDWQEGLAYLHAYVERERHARVPNRQVTPDGFTLGSWVQHQRSARARLSAERRGALEAVLGWTWDPIEDDWQEGLAHLRAYVERERHARVPSEYVTGDGYTLGHWVLHRRGERRKGQLRDDRAATLEAVLGWTWDPIGDDWQEGLSYLRAYVEREGDARVPQKYVAADGFTLGLWVRRQRSDHRGRLSAARRAVLEALPGWSWSVPRRPDAQSSGRGSRVDGP